MTSRESGRAAAAACVSREGLHDAYEVAGDGAAFAEGFVDACRQDADLTEYWRERLASIPTDVGPYLDRFEQDLLPGTIEAEAEFRNSGSMLDAWRDWTFPNLLSSTVRTQFSFLLLVDEERFLDAIERIPSQPLRSLTMAETLSPHAASTAARVAHLVPLAPGVLDGGHWNRRVALLLLLERAVNWALYLQVRVASAVRGALSDEARGNALLESAQAMLRITTELRDVFDALLRRPDGSDVAAAFGLHLAHRWLLAKGRPVNWHVEEPALVELTSALVRAGAANAIDQLAETLAATAPAEPDPVTLGGAAERTIHRSRLPALILKVNVARGHGPLATGDAAAALWTRYVELLAARDEGLDYLVNYTACGVDERDLGRLLSLERDPAAAFEAAWSRLEHHRRRMRFRSPDHTAANPSEHLLLVARTALQVLAPATSAKELWPAIARASFRLLQDEPPIIGGRASGRLPGLFAFLPAVFGTEWPLGIQWAAPLLEASPRLARDAARNIEANGVSRQDVIAAFVQAGIDLPAVENELGRWLAMGAHPNP